MVSRGTTVVSLVGLPWYLWWDHRGISGGTTVVSLVGLPWYLAMFINFLEYFIQKVILWNIESLKNLLCQQIGKLLESLRTLCDQANLAECQKLACINHVGRGLRRYRPPSG